MSPSASPAGTIGASEPDDRGLGQLLLAGGADLADADEQTARLAAQWRELREEFTRFRLYYQFGIEEVLTKVNILRQEFENTHSYSPIEHVRSRLKSPESLVAKVVKYGCEPTIPAVRARVRDIAGIRITCSFESDVYWIASMLTKQPDVTLVQTKDYIAEPKPNGYRSLHLIVQVPVFLSDRTELVFVEIQIRTIAMDFWASVEHKLFYKYRQELPGHLAAELDDAARIAAELDHRMARLRDEIRSIDGGPSADLPNVDG
ncbi:MAG: GTP pyrophosphokinase family protein [Propionicimonas sp.]|nr:GTP pyrophosphokinase family protein [Propionicimonas sp.]